MSFLEKRLILKQKMHVFSLETMCIVFRSKFYMTNIRTSLGGRIHLIKDSGKKITLSRVMMFTNTWEMQHK